MKQIPRLARKAACGILCLSMLCTTLPAEFSTLSAQAALTGDTNGDGTVSISDVVTLQKYLLQSGTLSTEGTANADMNADSKINGFDLAYLKRTLLTETPVSDGITIHLNDSGITVEGDTKGVTSVSGKVVTITASGNYTVDGSITDGQIFLESSLFFSGMRPAVNVGLSVSRVGGDAQTKAMKKAAGSLRIDLAQYREMEVFTQFSSDLDDATKEQLEYGSGLMELLKQPLGKPMSLADKVITLCAARHKVMLGIPTAKVKGFQMDMLSYFASAHPEIAREIEETKDLSKELSQKIVEIAEEFKKSRC